MDEKIEGQQPIISLGCGILAVGGVIGLVFLVGLVINRVQQTTRYPGARLASRQVTYSSLPLSFHQVDVYLAPAPAAETCRWYTARFDLIYDETEWGCLSLRGVQRRFGITHLVSVSVHPAARGSEIYVNHLFILPEFKIGLRR